MDEEQDSKQQVQPVTTGDGSLTLLNKELDEHYHSRHGAVTESKHVFIGRGLEYMLQRAPRQELKLLEVGFGTGLNFLLTAEAIKDKAINLTYHAIEPNPLPVDVLSKLGYGDYVAKELYHEFLNWYSNMQGSFHHNNINLDIFEQYFHEFEQHIKYNLIYYDAFSPKVQPEMWDKKALQKIADLLAPDGVMVTYCIRGYIKRFFQSWGMTIEALPGAPGKREMLRVIKPNY